MDLVALRHLLVILLIVLVVFGSKKLSMLGADLGAAVKGFKQSMRESESTDTKAASNDPQTEQSTLVSTTHSESTQSRPKST